MKINLQSVDPWAPRLELTLDRLPCVIGSDETADVILNDRWTSGRHCELFDDEGTLMVRDLGSRFGTLVGGKKIKVAAVESGDVLTVGIRAFRLVFRPSRRSVGRDRVGHMPAAPRLDRPTEVQFSHEGAK